MNKKSLRFRQVHLDFHTSEHIDGLGERFDKEEWQRALREARVNSITLFSKCHHGWSYHPTAVGRMHPHLGFDLLRAQYDACKEMDIQVPIYLSAGLDNVASHEHPEWRQVTAEGAYQGWAVGVLQPGFHTMDFFSPYLDYLCEQIAEVVRLFPECDGIFLDIVNQTAVCSRWGMDFMRKEGLDPESAADRDRAARAALERYFERATAAARTARPDMPVFHNAGGIRRGRREILKYFSHLELEALASTEGWGGYNHLPLSAKYVANLGYDLLGMTGKFHTDWGEFGGFKHPNALRYECTAMLAFNAKCSIGDQLHPGGRLDASTYRNIGQAYRDVEAKEPWCQGAQAVCDMAVLSSEAENGTSSHNPADEGAVRLLLESHQLFTVIDRDMDFSAYRMVILPDDIRVDDELKSRLDAYVARGGRLVLSGESGLWKDRPELAFDLGAAFHGPSEFSPDYFLPAPDFRPDFLGEPVVMYLRSQRIRVAGGQSLGQIFDPYFNRTYRHFCSHQHAPPRPEPSGFDGGVIAGQIAYFAHPVFSLYRRYGAVAHREIVTRVLDHLLGQHSSITTNLPSTARVSLNHQPEQSRYVLHLLFANTVMRGGATKSGDGSVRSPGISVEVIEDLLPLRDVRISLRNLPPIEKITLEPEGRTLDYSQDAEGIHFTLESFVCHQMVVLKEAK